MREDKRWWSRAPGVGGRQEVQGAREGACATQMMMPPRRRFALLPAPAGSAQKSHRGAAGPPAKSAAPPHLAA